MRLKKYKVTVVEHGKLVHIVVRGFSDRYSRSPLDQKGVTWCRGHVKEASAKGSALLAADALVDRAPVRIAFRYMIDADNGNDWNSGSVNAPLRFFSGLAAVRTLTSTTSPAPVLGNVTYRNP